MSKRARWQRDGGRAPRARHPDWPADAAGAAALGSEWGSATGGGSVPPPVRDCEQCTACCCRLEVLLTAADRVPAHLTRVDAWGRRTMARGADGWCMALHRDSLRCSIYAWRPALCRDFAMGGADCQAVQQDLLAMAP